MATFGETFHFSLEIQGAIVVELSVAFPCGVALSALGLLVASQSMLTLCSAALCGLCCRTPRCALHNAAARAEYPDGRGP